MSLKVIFELLRETFSEWSEDKASRLAAALAYYTIFSLAPLLIVVIAIAGLAFGQEAAQGQLVGQLQSLVGQEGAQLIETMIKSVNRPASGIIATIVGIATLLFGATGLFGQLQDALNTIWEVAPPPGRGVLGIIKDRFLSFSMVLAIGFLLLVSLVISAVLAALDDFLIGLLPSSIYLLQTLNLVISFGVITLLFAMIYKILPDVKIAWRNVWLGAAVTSLLFTLGKLLIGLYLGNSSVGSAYGAAGSLVILLLWIYYSAQILLFGAEFTQVYTRRFGPGLVPVRDAVLLAAESQTRPDILSSEKAPPAQREKQLTGSASRNAPLQNRAGLVEGARPKYAYAALFGLIAGLIIDTVRSGSKH